MKSYAEYLRELIGKNGELIEVNPSYVFVVPKLPKDATATLIDVGQDYAEFSEWEHNRLVPLTLLVVLINSEQKMTSNL